MDKIKLRITKDKVVIEEGGNSFLGKLLSHKGKIKINTPRVKGEFDIVSENQK